MGGFLLMNRDLSFPGYWALLPVSGAAMIVFAGPDAWFNRKILSNKIFVWFGLMSFPLYLWHWPLLSFGRILYFDTPPLRFRIPAVMASIALAWLTVRFIERPLRFGDQKSRLKVFVLSASLVVLAVVGVVFHKSDFSESHSFEKLRLREKGEHAIGSSISWYRGQDDWLFLGNAWSNTVAKLKLAVTPNESNVKDVKARFLKITEAGERFGVRTVLILGANKANIYPEYLPPGLTPSETKYSSFFLDKLREIPHLVVYDPTPDLLAAKPSEGFLYWKTDTHWNNKGAYLAYIGCLEQLNISAPRVTFKPGTSHRGDLIAISRLRNFPLPTDDNWDVVWKETPVWSEKEIPEGKKNIAFGPRTRVMNKRPLSNQTVWVVGDSFTAAIRQYFNATFREVRYVGHWAENINTLPDAIIKAESAPDFIFFVIAERSF